MHAAEEFTEYCAALGATAVYNVNRKKDSAFLTPDVVMWRTQSRRHLAPPPSQPQPAVRYALPGERPPSRRPPGQPDDVIDRFDHWARSRKGPHG